MMPSLRNTFVCVFLSALADAVQESEECWDASCGVNMQLLQSDLALQNYHTSAAWKDEESADEAPAVDVNLSEIVEQATVALSQFNSMISEGRAEGEVRLADRMGGHAKVASKTEQAQAANPKVLSYSSFGACGAEYFRPYGDTAHNEEWCGMKRRKWHYKKTFQCIPHVYTTECRSGIAKFMSLKGVGTGASKDAVLVDGCAYKYYAVYECLDVIIRDLTKEDNYTYLRGLENNLTAMVHVQSIVVSKATDKYLVTQIMEDTTDDKAGELEDDFTDADRMDMIAGSAHSALLYELMQKKKQLDAIQEAFDAANDTLQIVEPKYAVADAAYQAALGPLPVIEQNVEDAQSEYEEAQAALDAAESARLAAELAVENQTMKLQKEVAKLNEKNEELRKVQKQLDRPIGPPVD